MVEVFIALRHLKERKFQSIISVIGVSLALIVFITSLAVSNGLKQNMLNSLLTVNPHITMQLSGDTAANYNEILSELDSKKIVNKYPSMDLQGYIKYQGINVIPIIKAMDIKKLNLHIVDGKLTDDLASVVIGDELQKRLGAKIGDNLNLVDLNGREIIVKLAASFKTGFLQYDQNLVIIPLQVGQMLEQKGEIANNINITVKNPGDIRSVESLRNDIQNKYPDAFVYTWADENANLLSAIQFEEFILIVILSFLFIISSFVVAVILNISVREKTRDIGILKAYGFSQKKIKNIFLLEGIIVGIIGLIISSILTPIVIQVLKLISQSYIRKTYYISSLPTQIGIKEIAIIYACELIMVFLASVIPARKAAKLDPTEAIKFNI